MQKRVLGLTGPTGAGKGVAAEIFRREGCAVIDCDRIARAVTDTDRDCLRALAETFGSDVLRPDGTLDRRTLAARAFATRDGELALNAITHPPIMRRVMDEIGVSDAPVVVLDAPLLFESGADSLCDATVAVVANTELRCRRIMARDGIAQWEARRRISAQQAEDYYRSRAGAVFENDGSRAGFEGAVREWIRAYLGRECR